MVVLASAALAGFRHRNNPACCRFRVEDMTMKRSGRAAIVSRVCAAASMSMLALGCGGDPPTGPDLSAAPAGRGSALKNGTLVDGSTKWQGVVLISVYEPDFGAWSTCSGFITSHKTVVTAAHCVSQPLGQSSSGYITAEMFRETASGSYDVLLGADTPAFAKYNPAYNGWTKHDVAVITAPQPLTNISQGDAVSLLKSAPSGVAMWAMGYGLYDIHDYDIDNQGRSGQVAPTYDTGNQEYTFSSSSGEPWICSGDSGGPLRLVDYDWLAVGIASLTTGGQPGWHCGPTGHWASTLDNYAWLEYAISYEDCYEDDFVVSCW
jgi:hypothetical protein